MKWKTEKLADLLENLESGGRPRGGASLDSGGVPSLGGEHIGSDGEPILNAMKFIPRSYYESLNQGRIKKGDILIVKDGATTGKTAFVGENFPYEDAAVNEHVFIVRVNRNRLVPKFAFYWLFSPRGNRQVLSDFRGSAQGGISRSFVNQVRIPLPPLEEQRRIVEILDEADRLRKLRRQADAIAERILPALFYKMFGDPISNNKRLKITPLGELIQEPQFGISVALSEKTEKRIGHYPVLRIANVTNEGYLSVEDLRYDSVSEKTASRLILKQGDLLFNWRNSPNLVGKTAVFEEEGQFIFASFLFRLRTIPERANNYFVWFFLNELRRKGWFEAKCRQAVSQANFGREELAAIEVPTPPIDQQEKFASQVREINHLRRECNESKITLDKLFSTLLHRAFTGELTKRWREENSTQGPI